MPTARLVSATLLALGCAASAQAAVSVPTFFSDHMVLQRDIPVAIWGKAEPGEVVKVQIGDGKAESTTAGNDGAWRLKLPAMPAGGPHVMTISGSSTIRIEDVLVGEVWLCSGQSNMEWTVGGSLNAEQERAAATDGQIRQLLVPKRPLSAPEAKLSAKWVAASPDTAAGFTACGYFMARTLRKELGVPVGLINASWGGTRIEPWIPRQGFEMVPALADVAKSLQGLDPKSPAWQKKSDEHLARIEAWAKKARESVAAGNGYEPIPEAPADITPLAARKDPQQQPTTLYNGMLHALVGYGLRGAIWYQGESNHGEGMVYADKMKAMIGGWRQLWGIGDFPLYFVQIAPYRYNEDPTVLPRFWAVQNAAQAIPGTGMVVTTDIGTLDDIHPRNKQEVGRRLALQALAKTYGRTGVVADGPAFKGMTVEGGKAKVAFANAAGLKSRDGKPLNWFEVAGEDGEWVKAEAAIEGESVVVSAAGVAKPVGVRFAWNRDAEPNLANGAGLPAPAFSTGGAEYADSLPKIADAKGYQPVYDLDLTRLSGGAIAYSGDASATTKAFDRVAYLLELQKEASPVRFAWASMDAFTAEAAKLGVPTAASGASFQQAVKNLVVETNQSGVTAGSFAEGGFIEFWPNNYAPANTAKVPGASDAIYDFGDQMTEPRDGYGSMQVHNVGAKQTILALNNWKAGGAADLGLGTSTGEQRDWTFSRNASGYKAMRLRVFVRPMK